MHKYFGYNSCIATYENGEYPNLRFLPGLELKFIPKITGKFHKDSYIWLLKNSHKIDVLHLFHFGGRSFRQALVYKILNPDRYHGRFQLDGFKCKYWNKRQAGNSLKITMSESTLDPENLFTIKVYDGDD